jgi:outer membrane protein assembly factor BamB
VVTALDRRTGEQLWQVEWEGALQVPFFAASNGSWIRATPACDGERLYVAGIRDVLVCLEAATGKELWRVDFVEKYGTPLPAFGFASSPLLAGDHVYVQAAASFVKLDKLTGEAVWRTAVDSEAAMDSAFSSPIMARLGGRDVLVVQTRETLKGIDVETGDELWSQEIKAFRGMNILTPTVYQEALFTSAHSGRTQLWKVPTAAGELEEAWYNSAQGYMGSPVIIGDHAYLHLRNQRFSCMDLRTGEEAWRTKPYGKYWSLVAQGNRILALDETGDLRLIEADPQEFRLLDERHVTDASSWAHVAVSGEQVFVRSLDALIAYRWAR